MVCHQKEEVMAGYCNNAAILELVIPPTGIGWLDAAITRFTRNMKQDRWEIILAVHPSFDEFDKQHLKNKMDCEYLDWYFFRGGKGEIQTNLASHQDTLNQFSQAQDELTPPGVVDLDVSGPGLLGPKGQKWTAKKKTQQPTTTETKKKELDLLALAGVVVGIIGIAIAIRR